MDEVIRVSIGTEPKQRIASEVLKASIVRRTSRRVEFTESWTPAGWHHLMEVAPEIRNGTRFSTWRWMVPYLYGNHGKAIYLDADQVVLTDIAELWDALDSGAAFAAVINAIGIFGKKTPEPNKVQTSVMAMNCRQCEWHPIKLLRECQSGRLTYRALMQAEWLPRDRIQELEPAWNHFGIKRADTKLLHWSHVKSQPYRDHTHPTADVFRRELLAAVEAGYIPRQEVFNAVTRKHLDAEWGRVVHAGGGK